MGPCLMFSDFKTKYLGKKHEKPRKCPIFYVVKRWRFVFSGEKLN